MWYKNGVLDREDGPASTKSNIFFPSIPKPIIPHPNFQARDPLQLENKYKYLYKYKYREKMEGKTFLKSVFHIIDSMVSRSFGEILLSYD